jgi:hypothetical protein
MALNYYNVLGLEQNATKAEIKAAYRKLALVYHPDKNPGDASAQKKFLEIANAYRMLNDDLQRARYDRSLRDDDLEAFHQYWEQVKPEKRPPPPPYYYRYAREKVVYSPRTYALGALAIAAIAGLALLVPFFLLQVSAEQNYQKAVDLYSMGQYTTSLHYLDISMSEVGNKSAEAATLAGVILTHYLKNHDYALKYINKGLEYASVDSLRSELQYLGGLCYYNKAMPDSAIAAFEAVGDKSTKKDSAIFMTGIIYLTQTDNTTESLRYFNQALQRNKNFNKARYYRGLTLQKTGRHERAIDDFKYLINNRYEPAAAYYHKAKSEMAQDHMDDACFDLKMAMRYQLEEAKSLYALYCLDSVGTLQNGAPHQAP